MAGEGKQYRRWKRSHCGKWKYASRWAAWQAVVRIWCRQRFIDSLIPYPCRWGSDWQKGSGHAPLHWHVGHSKKLSPVMRVKRKLLYWVRRSIVWPYYRVRRHVRNARAKQA